MKRTLIISQEQLQRINEELSNATGDDAIDVNVQGDDNPQSAINLGNEVASKIPNSNVTVASNNKNGTLDSRVSASYDPSNPGQTAKAMNIYNQGGSIQIPNSNSSIAESRSFKKRDIEVAKKKAKYHKKGHTVFSKKDFAKKLDEDYMNFNNRLMERRKNYGK